MSGMVLRSGKNADIDRHPEANKNFQEGLGSVFRQWTALELAVHHEWGGSQSSQRANELMQEILDMFLGPERIYKDDITLVLEDFMETQLNTVCEDNSIEEISELLVLMWRECGQGNFNLVINALSREFQSHEILTRSQGIDNTGDMMDSDEEEEVTAGNEAVLQAITEEDAMDEEPPEPLVDEDGFESVRRKGKGKGKKK